MSSRPVSARSLKISWKVLLLPFGLFLILPLLALFLRISPSDLWQTLNQEQVTQALSLSLLTSLTTVLVTILFGTPVAYYLSHRRYRFHRLVDTLVDLPTVLPPAVAGVALLAAFGRRGLLGAPLELLGISLPFTQAAVVMAQTFIASPLYIKAAALGFSGVDCELRKAAALDGASRWQTFRYIIVPMSWVALLSGAVMTWARALGEFGATIIFAGNFPGRTQTMPLAIYIGFEIDLNVALTLAIILVCLAFLILVVVKAFLPNQVEVNPNDSDF
ncbi:MAG TPA: ABC transporter permease [Anaerolineaceae bacterium]|jgi:molybdate transport system permease protein